VARRGIAGIDAAARIHDGGGDHPIARLTWGGRVDLECARALTWGGRLTWGLALRVARLTWGGRVDLERARALTLGGRMTWGLALRVARLTWGGRLRLTWGLALRVARLTWGGRGSNVCLCGRRGSLTVLAPLAALMFVDRRDGPLGHWRTSSIARPREERPTLILPVVDNLRRVRLPRRARDRRDGEEASALQAFQDRQMPGDQRPGAPGTQRKAPAAVRGGVVKQTHDLLLFAG
jgi:hypothetical protein